MTKKQISGAIMVATGGSVADLAKKHNYSKGAFYFAINGRTKSFKVRKIIADTIGKTIEEIWPEKAKKR